MVTKRKKKQTKEQKDQIAQKKEIRSILARMGFHRIPGVEGKHFEYDSRKSELDDIFILENVFVFIQEKFKTNTIYCPNKLSYER